MDERIRSTTILCVRRDGAVALGGDGQVTIGQTVVKHDARKIRRLFDGKALAGFAGAAADAFALLERFEAKLQEFQGNLQKASIELSKEWRMDRSLRRLESLLAVADREKILLVSGSGDVIEPEDGILGIGSGGGIATAAAKALVRHTSLGAEAIVRESLRIAAGLCIYTNERIAVEVLA